MRGIFLVVRRIIDCDLMELLCPLLQRRYPLVDKVWHLLDFLRLALKLGDSVAEQLASSVTRLRQLLRVFLFQRLQLQGPVLVSAKDIQPFSGPFDDIIGS
jgi:hypothetical protein